MYEFKFPDVGEGITEGEVLEWLIKEGDTVKVDQVIAKIETDKAAVDVPSPKAGKILKLGVKEGDVIKVGQTLVTIGEDGEAVGSKEEKPAEQEKPPEKKEGVKEIDQKEEVREKPGKKKSVGVVGELEEAPEDEPGDVPVKNETPVKKSSHVMAMPAVRKLAKDKEIDINTITGSGKAGMITKEDVEKSTGTGKTEKSSGIKIVKKYDMYGYIDREPLKGIRKITATRMIESSTKVAAVTHMDEVDITHLSEIRDAEKAIAEKQDVKLTFLPFIIKAVINSMKEHPYLNSTLDEDAEEIIIKKYYNIGVAVDVYGSLIVPVVKGADKKGILDLAKEIEDLAEKSRNRKIDLADLKGGTFTITNIGSLGGMFATPIVNYPEAAILGLGRGYDKATVKDGKIVVRKVLPLSLTFDHRILDGAEAAKFVNDLKKYLEDPALLLV